MPDTPLTVPELYQAIRDAKARVGELEAEKDARWLECRAYWNDTANRLVAVAPAGTPYESYRA